jgi:tetrahydromethanopterin S-methyltransferase subunit D
MTYTTHKKLAEVGGSLIFVSGIVNALLGKKIGALVYEVYPGGYFGHVGILAGICAILIGLIIILGVVRIYESKNRRYIS